MHKLIILGFLATFTLFSHAHEGPPFAILVDHKFENHSLSIWADPDTKNGTFIFYLGNNEAMGNDLAFEISAHPKNAPSPVLKSSHFTSTAENAKNAFTTSLPFPFTGIWEVNALVKNKKNAVILTNVKMDLEVTPPGPSKAEALLYLLPFVIVGFIWVRVILYKKKRKLASN